MLPAFIYISVTLFFHFLLIFSVFASVKADTLLISETMASKLPSVCICVCVYTCMNTSVGQYAYQCTHICIESRYLCWLLFLQLHLLCFFETGSLAGLEFTKLASLAGQGVSETGLLLPPPHHCYYSTYCFLCV